jgi:hypothetical protein
MSESTTFTRPKSLPKPLAPDKSTSISTSETDTVRIQPGPPIHTRPILNMLSDTLENEVRSLGSLFEVMALGEH